MSRVLDREDTKTDDIERGGVPDEKLATSKAASEEESEFDALAKCYEPPEGYESKHRWDPKATWTEDEYVPLRRKLDRRVAFVACVCVAALALDKGNISQALSDNFLKDTNMTTADYNIGQTLFFLCYLSAELPSQLISKRLGSDVWMPIQMMSWSVVAISQCGIKNKGGFFATRALLGLMEGGFVPDMILYLSYYYTHAELTIRLSFFWCAQVFTNILAAFLGAGLLHLRHSTGWAGWRWLFSIEGFLTLMIGVWAWFYLPPGPTQTKSRWCKNGWFTDREEIIIVNKVLRDDPTKSSMHNRQPVNWQDLWWSITDYDLWPLYLLGLIVNIAPMTVNNYFTLTLKSLDYSVFQTNMLVIPANTIQIMMTLFQGWFSERCKQRLFTASFASWWHLLWLIVIITLPDTVNKWMKWAFLTMLVGSPNSANLLVSMNSMNAGSVRTRTVASSLYNMFLQADNLIASNVYQPSDKPYYPRGNRALAGIASATIVLYYTTRRWYIYRNNKRAQIWDNWSTAEKEDYLRTTTDRGNKRLDFRFLY